MLRRRAAAPKHGNVLCLPKIWAQPERSSPCVQPLFLLDLSRSGDAGGGGASCRLRAITDAQEGARDEPDVLRCV